MTFIFDLVECGASLVLWHTRSATSTGTRSLICTAELREADFHYYVTERGYVLVFFDVDELRMLDNQRTPVLSTEDKPLLTTHFSYKPGHEVNRIDVGILSRGIFADFRVDLVEEIMAIFEPPTERLLRGVKSSISSAYEDYIVLLAATAMPGVRNSINLNIVIHAPRVLLRSR